MKLTIAGASVYGLGNISDDSMLQSFLGGMREKLPNLDVSLICRHPGDEVEKMFGVRSIQNLDFPTKELSMGKRFRGFNAGDPTDHLVKIRQEIESSDALMIGGDPFIEITLEPFRGILPYTVQLITLAKYLGKKVILFGIHLGRPPTSQYGVELMKFCLDNADVITTREDDTKDKLVQNFGAVPEKIVSSADSGFALLKYFTPAAPAQKNYIALTVRSYYWLWDEETSKRYVAQCAAFADRLAAHHACDVIVVPHCAYELDNYWESDINFQKEILEHCKGNVTAVGHYLAAPELLGLIAGAKFVVSNRRHSGIYAALLGVPFYLFGERDHVGKVYESLGLPVENFVDEKHLDDLFSNTTPAFDGWDSSKIKAQALAQDQKCTYAIDAIAALLHT